MQFSYKPTVILLTLWIIYGVTASEESGSRRKQKYRIVKVYGRKLKPQTTSDLSNHALNPPNNQFYESVIPSHETQIASTTPSFKTDQREFDINNVLASTEFRNAATKDAAPTIIQFSAPSSDSYLDPEYLSKLIREQLGSDAEFTILPQGQAVSQRQTVSKGESYSGNLSKNPKSPAKEFTTLETTTVRPSGSSTLSPYNTHYAGRTLIPPSAEQSDSWTKYPSHPLSKSKGYPHHPVANSQIRYSSSSHSKQFLSTTTLSPKKITSRPKPIDTTPTSVSFDADLDLKSIPSGYSTLGGELSVPAQGSVVPVGEYGVPSAKLVEEKVPVDSNKYSTSFVRGFIHDNYDTTPPKPKPQIISKGEPSHFRSTTASPKPDSLPLKDVGGTKYYYSREPVKTYVISPVSTTPHSVISQALTAYSQKPVKYKEENFKQNTPGEHFKFSDSGDIDNYQSSSGHQTNKYVPSFNHISTQSPHYYTTSPSYYKSTEIPAAYHVHSTSTASPPSYRSHSTVESILQNSYPTQSPSKYVSDKTVAFPTHQTSNNLEWDSYSPPAPQNHPNSNTKPPVLSKTIYVNLPPVTPKPTPPPVPVLPQRHYKIIFVKAPTPPPPEEPEVHTTPAPISKTIIYVLHKKPDPPPKLIIPTQAPTLPSKPEVHFIQYREKPKIDEGYSSENIPSSEESSSYDDEPAGKSYDFQYDPYSNESEQGTQENAYGTDQEGAYTYDNDNEHSYDYSSSPSSVRVNVKKSISSN